MSGSNVGLNFFRRPEPSNENPYPAMSSRQSTQLNFLTVEEGHFENGKWIADFYRNGDESNFELYVRDGGMVRIRLTPDTGMDID